MKKKTEPPLAPVHLRPDTRKWWGEIVGEYMLEPSDLRVLESACTCWDRAASARETLDKLKDGPFIVDRFGQPREHPAAGTERDSTRLFLSALRQLGLGLEPPNAMRLPDHRPPNKKV